MWNRLRPRLALLIWATAGIGLLVATALDPKGIRRALKLRSEVAELRARNAQDQREHDRLSRQVHALRDNREAIERAVRDELGFIRPGELILELRQTSEVAEGHESGP
jgi:cell division protein FtsB